MPPTFFFEMLTSLSTPIAVLKFPLPHACTSLFEMGHRFIPAHSTPTSHHTTASVRNR